MHCFHHESVDAVGICKHCCRGLCGQCAVLVQNSLSCKGECEAEVAAMTCPVCRVPLAMSERQGIEIDYCPQCRGVWLDRGELDKIIERNAASLGAQPAPPQQQRPQQDQQGQQGQQGQGGPWGGQDRHGGHGYGHKPYKRRRSFLEDLFD